MTASSQIRNLQDERLDVAFHGGDLQSVVVLGHGLTGNKDRPLLIAVAEGLASRGWSCIRVSFSGNGNSEGRFEEATITKGVADLRAIFSTIPQEKGIAYVGHSMGGAIGVMTASSGLNIRALVSLAGMTHIADFVEREFGDVGPDHGVMWEDPDFPLSSVFVNDLKRIGDTLESAANVTQPWLLIHGTGDEVVPLKDSHDAYAAAKCRKELLEIPGAGHTFDEASFPPIIEAIDAWLEKSFGRS